MHTPLCTQTHARAQAQTPLCTDLFLKEKVGFGFALGAAVLERGQAHVAATRKVLVLPVRTPAQTPPHTHIHTHTRVVAVSRARVGASQACPYGRAAAGAAAAAAFGRGTGRASTGAALGAAGAVTAAGARLAAGARSAAAALSLGAARFGAILRPRGAR
jgi:hypothetical protein